MSKHPFLGMGFNSWAQKFSRPSSGFNIPIITDGLFMYLDAGAYSGSGTTWSDLVGSNNATLVNGPTFVASDGTTETGDGYFDFDGSDDRADLDNFIYPTNYSIHLWIQDRWDILDLLGFMWMYLVELKFNMVVILAQLER